MTPRENFIRAARFENPECIPLTLAPEYGSDLWEVAMVPSPEDRPHDGVDEWGCVWENIGISNMGEVKESPLKDWSEWDSLKIPDIEDPERWEKVKGAREEAGDRFLMAYGISLYERVHFIRGLENAWMDIYQAPDELARLLDILVDMNVYAVRRFAGEGADGYLLCDDWGLQDRLMISPDTWRRIWKPRYARVYDVAHEAGLVTLLHSCGNIVDIMEDLIEIGLDVIQMDQQENMGLDTLGARFAGRIAFWCPVDIQNTMARGTLDDIRAYTRRMVETLGCPEGGFIAKWYGDPRGAGHRPDAIAAMSEEFIQLSARHPDLNYRYGKRR